MQLAQLALARGLLCDAAVPLVVAKAFATTRRPFLPVGKRAIEVRDATWQHAWAELEVVLEALDTDAASVWLLPNVTVTGAIAAVASC
jgi:hypothetical protein